MALPIISFLPALATLIFSKTSHIVLADIISNKLLTRSTFAAILLYLIYFSYRQIYLRDEDKKMIAPLLFIFNFNMIHNVSFLFGAISLISNQNISNSSNIGICYLVSIITVILQTFFFEVNIYNKTSKNSILDSLNESQINSSHLDILLNAFISISLTIISVNDVNILYNFGLLGILTVWNLLFARVIRPQLFLFIKNE